VSDRRIETLFAWCGPAGLGLFLVGFWFVAGLVPPPSAADSANQIAHFYRESQSQLRIGLLIAMTATPLLIPFLVLLTRQISRSDPRLAPLAQTQLICGVFLVLLILLSIVLMGVAAFRPGRSPELTQLMNDTAFTILLWVFAPTTLEFGLLGAAALMDRGERPLFPRWMGYFDLAVGVVFLAGAPTLFVKRGAFGWDGSLAFWGVLIAFGLWIAVTFLLMLRATDRQFTEPEPVAGPVG
jgi:hypothetical protein